MRHLLLAVLLASPVQDPDLPALLANLNDDDITVRDDAQAALKRLTPASLPALKQALAKATGDARARLAEIVDLLDRTELERTHDAAQRARFLKTDRPDEGLTLLCTPAAKNDGIIVTTTLTPAPGLECSWTVTSAADEKGGAVKMERCGVCSPRLVFAATQEPVRLRVAGVRRWFSDYDVVFENPRNGESRRIGGFTLEIAWPHVVITSEKPVPAAVLTRTATSFAFDLRRPPSDVIGSGGCCGCGRARIVRGGPKKEPPGWCPCANGPSAWKEAVVPMATRHAISGPMAEQAGIDQVARIRLTFRKPIEESFEIESALLKP